MGSIDEHFQMASAGWRPRVLFLLWREHAPSLADIWSSTEAVRASHASWDTCCYVQPVPVSVATEATLDNQYKLNEAFRTTRLLVSFYLYLFRSPVVNNQYLLQEARERKFVLQISYVFITACVL